MSVESEPYISAKNCAVTICITAIAPFAQISTEIECHKLGLGIFDPLDGFHDSFVSHVEPTRDCGGV